eukprot:scaffold2544_cov245-Pinguiococcus_pyrenoidosus.AAC.10
MPPAGKSSCPPRILYTSKACRPDQSPDQSPTALTLRLSPSPISFQLPWEADSTDRSLARRARAAGESVLWRCRAPMSP